MLQMLRPQDLNEVRIIEAINNFIKQGLFFRNGKFYFMQIKASTVDDYIDKIPDDRKEAIKAIMLIHSCLYPLLTWLHRKIILHFII